MELFESFVLFTSDVVQVVVVVSFVFPSPLVTEESSVELVKLQ